MAFSYDSTLPSDRDWVRFQIRDTVEANAVFQDSEIDFILTEEANKWLAAASIGEMILAKNLGVTSKSVGGLSVSFGDGADSSYRAHLKSLREEGCRRLLKTNSIGAALMRL